VERKKPTTEDTEGELGKRKKKADLPNLLFLRAPRGALSSGKPLLPAESSSLLALLNKVLDFS
jgi:hypothetical protein